MESASAVTDTDGDRGAMIVRFAPSGPVLENIHAAGEMKLNVFKMTVVIVMVKEDIPAKIVRVSAWAAVMVREVALGRLRNIADASVVMVTTTAVAASTTRMEV